MHEALDRGPVVGRIDAYASQRHYADHLAPVWLALPESIRGTFYAPPEVVRWAKRLGAPYPVEASERPLSRTEASAVLVAGIGDHWRIRPVPTILLNHGAGQSYRSSKGAASYSGGPDRERVLLHLEPGALAATASAAAGHPYATVGCPRLDLLHASVSDKSFVVKHRVVAIAIRQHDPPQSCPEQRCAWPHYEPVMAELAASFDLIGHGHPRGWLRAARKWEALGVPAHIDSYDVLEEADVLVTDSSSIGWEFASLGKPVVWCNAPWYRRDVWHGGRFWAPLPGIVVDEPAELPEAIETAAWCEPWWERVDQVYAVRDGSASRLAANAVSALVA